MKRVKQNTHVDQSKEKKTMEQEKLCFSCTFKERGGLKVTACLALLLRVKGEWEPPILFEEMEGYGYAPGLTGYASGSSDGTHVTLDEKQMRIMIKWLHKHLRQLGKNPERLWRIVDKNYVEYPPPPGFFSRLKKRFLNQIR